jgi:hypothetical protein
MNKLPKVWIDSEIVSYDSSGLYVDIDIAGIVQRMRWNVSRCRNTDREGSRKGGRVVCVDWVRSLRDWMLEILEIMSINEIDFKKG